MMRPRQRQLLLILVTLVMVGSTLLVMTANSRANELHPGAWVASWEAAPMAAPTGDPASFGYLPESVSGFKDQTLRMYIHTSVGGNRARVRISNQFGTKTLQVGHATIGVPWMDAGPGDLQPGSVHELHFSGQPAVWIPPGGYVYSDPVSMNVPWTGDLAVSLYLPTDTGPPTTHYISKSTSYVGPGDHAASPSGADLSRNVRNWYFVTGLDVYNHTGAGAVVVLGDSITDGNGSTSNTNHRWPNLLAARINKVTGDNGPAIVSAGIAGNRLGHDGTGFPFPLGPAATARFAPDVLGETGVRAVILELGINDIWISHDSADTIIAEMQQVAALAHAAGLKIFVCTLSPWNAYTVGSTVYYTPELDSVRLSVNSYLRTTSDFDGVIDFDRILRDPSDPTKLRSVWDATPPKFVPGSGDHIHPDNDGNQAMADQFPLNLLLGK